MSNASSTWSSICRCWAVTQTNEEMSGVRRNWCTTGAILMASGRVPKTVNTFIIPSDEGLVSLGPSLLTGLILAAISRCPFSLQRAVQPIAGVTQPGDDVAVLVQPLDHRRHVVVQVRMFQLDFGDD